MVASGNWGLSLRLAHTRTIAPSARSTRAHRRPPRRPRRTAVTTTASTRCGAALISLERSLSPPWLRFNPTLDRLHRVMRIFSISTTKSGASLAKNPPRLPSARLSAPPPSIQENTLQTPSAWNRIRLLSPHLQQGIPLLVFLVRIAFLYLLTQPHTYLTRTTIPSP